MIRKIVIALFPIAVLVILTGEIMSDNGKAGRTGSPGEANCRDCHSSYALGAGGGSVTLQDPMTAFQYTPGQTYNMSVTVSRTGTNLFGIGLEALTASNSNAGTLNITDAASTTIKTATVSGVSRRNLVHKLNGGASSNSKVFNFSWTAPAAGAGPVTFYYSGVAANGNNNDNSDYVYVGSQVFTELTCQPPVSTITVSGDTLYASPGTSYEWYLDGNFIPGATQNFYVPVQNGNYILIVYDGGCSGTSTPYAFSTVGINSINNENNLTVYHNPVSKTLFVNAVESFSNSQLLIFDNSGRTIKQAVLHNGENSIELNGLADGIYTVLAGNGNNKITKRIFITN